MSIESTRTGFYSVWPIIDGKNIQYQWGEIRSNTADTKAIVRGSIQDMESGVDELNSLRAYLGQEYGDLDFKNKFSVYYNKTTQEHTIRKNTGTVDTPVWEELVQIRFNDGQFQVVSQGGIFSAAGFYGPGLQSIQEVAESGSAANSSVLNPTKIFFDADTGLEVTEIAAGANKGQPEIKFTAPFGKAQSFSKTGAEWVVNHNFGLTPVLVQVMDSDDRVVIPDKADLSDPNTAYFYFNEVTTGTALIASGGVGAASLVPRDPFYLTVRTNNQAARPDHTLEPNADLIFDSDFFYVNVDMDTDTGGAHKKAYVSLTANADSLGSPHNGLTGLTAGDDHPQYVRVDGTNVQTGEQQGSWLVKNKIVAEAFYLKDGGEAQGQVAADARYIKRDGTSTQTGEQQGSWLVEGKVVAEAFYLKDGGGLDHGELSGLADDDHPQYVRVDGTNVQTGEQQGSWRVQNDVIAEAFYVQDGGNFSAGPNGTTLVNKAVVDNVEVLSGDSKNITPDFALSNTYFVALEKNTTINNPTNLPGSGIATTVQIVTEQPSEGFYSITWDDGYMFPLEQLGGRGGPNPTQAEECIDVFTFVSIPNLRQGEKLLGVSAQNFY